MFAWTDRLAPALALGLLSILGCSIGTSSRIVARGRRAQVLVLALRGGGQGLVVVVGMLVTVRGRLRLVIDGHLVGHASVSGGDSSGRPTGASRRRRHGARRASSFNGGPDLEFRVLPGPSGQNGR